MSLTNNPLELLVSVRADTTGSQLSIQKQLDKLSTDLKGLNVALKFDDNGLKGASGAVEKLNTKMEEITLSTQKAERAQRDLERSSSSLADKALSGFERKNKNIISSLKQLEAEFKGKDFTIKADYDVKSGTKVLKGYQVDVKQTEDIIDRIKYKMRDLSGGNIGFEQDSIQRINKASFDLSKNLNAVDNKLKLLNQEGKISNAVFNELSEKAQRIGTSSGFKKMETEIKQAVVAQNQLNTSLKSQEELSNRVSGSMSNRTISANKDAVTQAKAVNSALDAQYLKYEAIKKSLEQQVFMQKLTQEQANKFKNSISVQTPLAQLKEQESLISRQVILNERNAKELREQANTQERIRKLTNEIITAQRKSPNTIGTNTSVKDMLTTLERINPASATASTSVKNVSDSFSRLRAESTSAGRESMGVMESFKIAMEKFPVWMAASTAFFGAIRTSREFMEIILTIDTRLTDLKKVMDDSTDFEKVFDRATESAERFGQSIANAMDSYIEFAKQGYVEEELGILADAGLVASNVGDITAQKASEYMTSALVQWKLDAKDAMGIIDSLIIGIHNSDIMSKLL